MKLTVQIELYIEGAPKLYDLTLDQNLRVVDLRATGIGGSYPLQLLQAGIEHDLVLSKDVELFAGWQEEPSYYRRFWSEFARNYLEVLFIDPNRSTKKLEGGSVLTLMLRAPRERRVDTFLTYTFEVKTPVFVEAFGPWGDHFARRDITLIDMSQPVNIGASVAG